MTVAFDPYRIWLGIPPEEQPPHYYRLLGIGLFESDADVICNAADRQMAHVRTFQTGPHSAQSQRVLNELAAARLTLLDPARRAAYDAQLQQALAAIPGVEPVEPSTEKLVLPPTILRPPVQRRPAAWQGLAVMGLILVLGLALLAWAMLRNPYKPLAGTVGLVEHSSPVALPPPQPKPKPAPAAPLVPEPEPTTVLPSLPEPESEEPTLPEPVMPQQPEPKVTLPVETPPAPPAPSDTPPAAPEIDRVALARIKGLECRREPARSLLRTALGGTEATQKAVEEALTWLAKQQSPEGSWTFERRDSNDPKPVGAPRTATALAVLALAGAGQTERDAEHRLATFRGAQYLIKQMGRRPPEAGSLWESGLTQLPSHPLATTALCEVGASGRNKTVMEAAQNALRFLVRSQNQDGGWSALPPSPDPKVVMGSDIYGTGWSATALATARLGHVDLPEATLARAVTFLDQLNTPDRSEFRHAPGQGPNPVATAFGFLARQYLGWKADKPEVEQYLTHLERTGPRTDGSLEYNFLTTTLLRNHPGPSWDSWQTKLRDWLLAQQIHEGPEAGSWNFSCNDPLVRRGGSLYCTAMATLILESYYRYPPPPALLKSNP